jgi:hypothetical protein
VGHSWLATGCSSANIFFCGKQHAPIHERVEAHNGKV